MPPSGLDIHSSFDHELVDSGPAPGVLLGRRHFQNDLLSALFGMFDPRLHDTLRRCPDS